MQLTDKEKEDLRKHLEVDGFDDMTLTFFFALIESESEESVITSDGTVTYTISKPNKGKLTWIRSYN